MLVGAWTTHLWIMDDGFQRAIVRIKMAIIKPNLLVEVPRIAIGCMRCTATNAVRSCANTTKNDVYLVTEQMRTTSVTGGDY